MIAFQVWEAYGSGEPILVDDSGRTRQLSAYPTGSDLRFERAIGALP